MTRDELISRTRQLIDEGDRLLAQPSMGAMQLWLQLSDDLLATAWGSMDRYHLAWLMVGKPKSIVRGRPMTPDEEAAYVREVASQKTAALRMSLDAVDRQGMPFVGETGGGLGEGGTADRSEPGVDDRPRPWPTERRIVPACPRTRRSPIAWRRPAAGPRPIGTTMSAGLHVLTACSGDREPATWSPPSAAPGACRHPTRSPPTTSCSGSGSTSWRPGIVDAYYGPAELKARVDMEQVPTAARLRADAVALIDRLDREVEDEARRAWLTAQVVALEAQARALGGEPPPYLEHVELAMGFAPLRRDDGLFDAAARVIDGLLPGPGSLDDRLQAWDRSLEVPEASLPDVVDWLLTTFRARAARDFGLPEPEGVAVTFVRDQPWSAYNWYDGGRRSRIDVNLDLPVRAPSLIPTIAHETYPGHHLEQAWKEADLVDGEGRLEASILLINTPESPISEGLADVGTAFASPLAERAELLVELFERAGMAVAEDATGAREIADRAVALAGPRETLRAARGTRRCAATRTAHRMPRCSAISARPVGSPPSRRPRPSSSSSTRSGEPTRSSMPTEPSSSSGGSRRHRRPSAWGASAASSTSRSRRVDSSRSWAERDRGARPRSPGKPGHREAGGGAGQHGEADDGEDRQAPAGLDCGQPRLQLVALLGLARASTSRADWSIAWAS